MIALCAARFALGLSLVKQQGTNEMKMAGIQNWKEESW
jgi:hypothetical protein